MALLLSLLRLQNVIAKCQYDCIVWGQCVSMYSCTRPGTVSSPHNSPGKFDSWCSRFSLERPSLKTVYGSRDTSSLLDSGYNLANQRKDPYRPSYQASNQSSDDRPPSPSGRSDISESTTVLMAGYEAYRPLSRTSGMSSYFSWSKDSAAFAIFFKNAVFWCLCNKNINRL